MDPKAGFLTGSIKSLPEDVRNSVRSGIFLSDLTRVVEELVYNSLDAGATKVSVWVSMGTCYIKVVDDGAGISRDGLGLLGERYATSKRHHNGILDAADGSFGSRGEALASISDVSLLEVVTKAYGRPNGYRKVIKGSKCLYVGIDDDRRDVGTTVTVRDLFYNQPVRRKCIQSSPKKVLHSVKKCVLRIALVHPKVSFKVFDIESENELLCTHPSTSPLPLLMSCFGIEDSSSFQELNVSEGELMLTGYISGPCSSFPIKVFQYAYINSRFTCKGPIHKLVNHLATEFEDMDLWKANSESQRGKKTKPPACPAYIVNLSCPQSLYDLTFEPSKTCVEFKDWVPVLTFIEKAILHFWRKTVGHGESSLQATDIEKNERQQSHSIKCAEDFSGNTNFAMRKCGIHNNQISLDLPSSPTKILSKGSNNLFQRKPEQFHDLHKNISQLDRQPTEKKFVGQTHYAFQSLDGPFAKCTSDMPQRCHESYSSLWIPDSNLCLTENYSPRNMFTAVDIFNDHVEDHITSSTRQNKSSEVEPYKGSIGSSFSFDTHEFSDDAEISKDIQKPLLQSCYSQERLSLDGAMFANDEELEPQIQFQDEKMKRKRAFPDYMSNISDVEIGSRRFDFYSRTSWQDGMSTDFDLCPGSEKWFLSDGEHCDEENNLSYHSYKPIRDSSSYHNSFKSDWSPLAFKAAAWNFENCPSENALTGRSRPSKRTNYGYCPDGEPKGCRSGYEIINYSYCGSCTAFCTKAPLDFQDYDDFDSDFCESRKRHKQYSNILQENSDMKTDKTGWLSMDSSGEDNTGADKYERQRHLKPQAHAHTSKARSMRSHSAPPFYREKKRFISLSFHLMMEAGNTSGSGELKPSDKPSGMYNVQAKPNLEVDLSPNIRSEMKIDNIRQDPNDVHKDENLEQSILLQFNDTAPLQDFSLADSQDSPNPESKWRNNFPQIANNNKSLESHISNSILNISSGFLHLAGDSLIPESITKSYLKDAKVLQQVDKKFIPVISGGVLAVIDQHAADERIRLEELREKVLSGEARTTAYLDAEKELVLPEIGYQLLDNYAEQIKDWGWICNIHAQDSRSFKKNMDLMHRRPAVVTLLAVPCILGVKLSDVDLLEFIQQLSDTDGSSTIPPSVLKVLNYKACRGAIMFGDSLLPSECSLIVEELKQTSLCFQCAHGRPTTVPLVNLVALRKQIPKLGLSNESSNEPWHGLRRHELSLERTVQRLRSAI